MVDHLFYNSFELNYQSHLKLNEFVLDVGKNDIVVGFAHYLETGIFSFQTGIFDINKHFAFIINNPGNGRYKFQIYSRTPINTNISVNYVDRSK
jgi:hypothetical protein